MTDEIGNYEKSPNELILVLNKKKSTEQVNTFIPKEKEIVYVERTNELAMIEAARNADIPIALIGGAGIGKTTLVWSIAAKERTPLITIVGDKRAKLYQLVGYVMELGNQYVYNDGPISIAARAPVKSILYIDEAIAFPSDVFTSLSPLLDHRVSLAIKETGEYLSAKQMDIILSFNPPPIESIDELPKPATLDRMAMIRFESGKGSEATDILATKYGLRQRIGRKSTGLNNKIPLDQVIEKYGEVLGTLYDELNSNVAAEYAGVVVKKVTPRSLENTFKLIAEGLPIRDAATIAMVNPMSPVDDELSLKFLRAAEEVVNSRL